MIVRPCFALVCSAFVISGCVPAEMAEETVPPQAALVEVTPPAEPAVAEPPAPPAPPPPDSALVAMYATRADGERTLPAIDVTAYHRDLLRSHVDFATGETPGTIVIDTKGPFLYLVESEGKATRYGVAIGREGFGWTGTGTIAREARWPRWTPPAEMIKRDPSLAEWAGGMPGGVKNPLGARALYINFGGADSGYRIHGTNTPKSIGWAASSGCFRMLNQDVIDLYDRVAVGAKVVVL